MIFSKALILGSCLTQTTCLPRDLDYTIILHSTSFEPFKGEFVNHSGNKCCKKGLKGIICSQAQDEELKKQAVFKKRADG